MKQRFIHSCGVVTPVHAVQSGKDTDVENQGVALWKQFLNNRRKSINIVTQNNCTLTISVGGGNVGGRA